MSVYDNIRATFEKTLNDTVGLPSIAWENVSFNPDTTQSYLKVRMVPTRREPAARGVNPQMYYQGYFLVECCVPLGNGPSAGDTLADTIIDTFDATSDISYNGTILHIRYAERDLGVQESSHYSIQVRIGWYLYQ